MSAYIDRKIRERLQTVVCARVHTAKQSLSTWLLHADGRIQDSTLDITQRMLADIQGLRLATVSESCNRLLCAGAIQYSRGKLEIVDRALLEGAACECYDAVRLSRLSVGDTSRDWP